MNYLKYSGRLFSILFFGVFIPISLVIAQPTPYLVSDIHPGKTEQSSIIREFTEMGGHVYFAATNNASGREIWRTDGTSAGTEMVKDIRQGGNSSSPDHLTAMGSYVYFSADDGVYGTELWRSDGTQQGTTLVSDIEQGSFGSWIDDMVALNNLLIFKADGGVAGDELWMSDGSSAGTTLLKDIQPGSGSAEPEEMTVSGNKVFFIADDGVSGEELWVTDGTTAGTQLVKDINSGSADADINEMYDFNGMLYFRATDGINGNELWKSDGTNAGTIMVSDISSGAGNSYPSDMVEFNDTLYFNANDGVNGAELWKSDGTQAGTVMVKDISPGAGFSSPGDLFNVNDQFILFYADNGSDGSELWKSDGSTSGTVMLLDINPGSADGGPNQFISVGNEVFFSADDGSGFSLWKTDGTSGGTSLVKNVFLSEGIAFNNALLFRGYLPGGEDDLWKSDGTTNGTEVLKEVAPNVASSNPQKLYDVNGQLFFGAEDSVGGSRGGIFISNGNAAEYLMPVFNNEVGGIGKAGSKALISARSPQNFQYELYASDGSVAGTTLIDSTIGMVNNFLPSGNFAYFSNTFQGIWRSNGTTAGTDTFASAIQDIYSLSIVLGELAFEGTKGNTDALWKADASGNVQMIKDINPSGLDYLGFGTDFNGLHYFSANDSGFNIELWVTDGTNQGTAQLLDINPSGSSNPSMFKASDDLLFFMADDGTHGNELWKTDGTQAGTEMLKDISSGAEGTDIRYPAVINGLLVFSALTENEGRELWVSDGTESGTKLLKDIYPGKASGVLGFPNRFVEAGEHIYFSADDGSNGVELWITDGTSAGTRMVSDLNPGIEGSVPQEITLSGNKLFFTAFHPEYGRELWALEVITVGIENHSRNYPDLSIYPNPAHHQITIGKSTKAEAAQISVRDVFGKLIYRNSVADERVNISVGEWPAGFYIATEEVDGNPIATGKFVVQ